MDLKCEYTPKNRTEMILVERMAQHHWLRSRATMLQGLCFLDDGTIDDKRLALYLRYETTHERAFHKCLNELLRIRAEKRKQEIGFECGTCKIAVTVSAKEHFSRNWRKWS